MAKDDSNGITAVILGKRWTIVYESLKGYKGKCDPPDAPRKKISIKKNMDELTEMDTVIHEMLHAFQWHLDEEIVDQAASDMSRILWRLGWRKSKQ